MSKLKEISEAPMIREYAQKSAQDGIAPVANFLAPVVEVSTAVGKYKRYTSKSRFHLPNTLRSIGGRASVVGWDAKDETFDCKPHALDCPIDVLESGETEDFENLLQEAADEVAAIGALSHEKSVIDGALAALTPIPVNFGPLNDPVAIMDQVVLDVMKAARFGSIMKIGVLFGADAFVGVKNHPKVTGKFIAGGGKGPKPLAVVDESVVSDLLVGGPEVRVSFMVYDRAAEGLPEDIQFILQNGILVFARQENPTRRDPSFMKTFRLRNKWMVPGVYERDDGRVEVAKFDWSEDVKVTNAPAGALLIPNFNGESSSSSSESSSSSGGGE